MHNLATVKATPGARPYPCFIALGGWAANGSTLYGTCLYPRYMGVVESRNPPAMFKMLGIPGHPPAMGPDVATNDISMFISWTRHPDLVRPLPRWTPPTEYDCSRRLANTDGCLITGTVPGLLEVSEYMRAASHLKRVTDKSFPLTYYWDEKRQAVLAVYKPSDTYINASFYAGDYLVDLRMLRGMEKYYGVMIDQARRWMPEWVKSPARFAAENKER